MVVFVAHLHRLFFCAACRLPLAAAAVRCVLMPGLMGLAATGFVDAQPMTERAEDRFLRQLTERGFFELAEQHCRHQQTQATDVEASSAWQLRLMETYRQHAWFASSDNRHDLLNQSLELLTDFLKNNLPAPQTEFRLRLEQVQTLVGSLRMTLILTEAGHLFAAEQLPNQLSEQASAKLIAKRGIELVTSLLQQLENMRRDLDATDVRELKDEFRIQLAELHCLQWRMTADGNNAAAVELAEARQALQTASRTVTDRLRKHRLKWLTAELALWTESQQQFDLRMGAVNSEAAPDDFTLPEFLQIRWLLRTQEATAALQLAIETPATTALQMQQRDWLKLEALLGVRELLGQLNDAALVQTADQEFQREWNRIRLSSAGVFADAAVRVNQRYALVSEVGADIADLIEQVDRQRQNGDLAAATRLIEVTLNRMSSGGSVRAIAALNLRGGELLLEQQQWAAAKQKLETAGVLYADLQMEKQHSVADLLRIYVLAKLWAAGESSAGDSPATDSPADNQTVSKADYVAALQQHLQRFGDQATAGRARDWLLQAVKADRPYLAAGLLLDQFDLQQLPSAKLDALEQAGDLLLSAYRTTDAAAHARPLPEPGDDSDQDAVDVAEQNDAEADSNAADLVQRFRLAAEAAAQQPQRSSEDQLAAVQLLLLEFEILDTAATSEQWQQRDQRLSELRQQLNSAADIPAWAVPRATVLQAVTAAKSSAGSEQLAAIRDQLLELDAAWQQTALDHLATAIINTPDDTGSIWLARTCEVLIDRLRQQTPPQITAVEQALRLLPKATLVGAVTGRQDTQDQLLQQLLKADLQPGQLDAIAKALSQSSSAGSSANTSTDRVQPAVQKFWRQILTRHSQGSPLWLEASLQLAQHAANAGDQQSAKRQLLVVQTLYPDWGDKERQQRAAELRKRLDQIPSSAP